MIRSALMVILIFVSYTPRPAGGYIGSCSTFLLAGPSSLLVGHNLDEIFHTPGWVVVSPRGVSRRDVCGKELMGRECKTPDLHWSARYGSVAFGFGADLADGGMNEAGLTVSEMGLGQTRHPYNADRPSLLTRLWIRYQLDMYATVEEVIDHLDDLNIDGNNLYSPVAVTWAHYFFSDATGKKAIIEFLDGKAIVHDDASVDVPVLCNEQYRRERSDLERYWRFGGWMPIFETLINSYPRFVQGAYLADEYVERTPEENTAYAFGMLKTMQRPDTRQWSIVYDVREHRISFRTVKGSSVRFVDMDDLSFEPGRPIRVLTDIHQDAAGDISSSLVDWDAGMQEEFIRNLIQNFAAWAAHSSGSPDVDTYLSAEEPGLDLARYMQRAVDAAAMIRE